MKHTTTINNDTYGTLILTGEIHPAEPETDTPAHAVLESVLTYGGEELLTYRGGNPANFSRAEVREMEGALLSNGEAVK